MRYLLLIVLSGCGAKISMDPIKVDPVQVNVTHTIDFEKLQQYCEDSCVNSNAPEPAQCINDCVRDFLNILSLVGNK